MATMACTCSRCMFEFHFPTELTTFECPACGKINSRPIENAEVRARFERAVMLWKNRDFGRAAEAYDQVLNVYPNDHEAIWGRLMCHYGVEYIQDTDGTMRPTIHITRDEEVRLQTDYRLACEKAPENVCAQYEEDAKYIERALQEIRRKSETCRSYDVFLCHKSTPLRPDGERGQGGETAYRESAGQGEKLYTEDLRRAYSLYHWLVQKGYHVFFAPEVMDKEIGADYEAAIYHALKTARTMLVVCSSVEHLNAVWVRSEWLRFMNLMRKDSMKRLIPVLYGGMSEYQLPQEFQIKHLQAIEINKEDAYNRLLSAIESSTGKDAQNTEAAASSFDKELTDDGYVITGYHGCDVTVNIPERIDHKRVVGIEKEAFRGCRTIKRLRLPEGVTMIGERAFQDCAALHDVSLPVSLKKIGNSAFFNCTALEKVELPSRLEEIGDFAFECCASLEYIEIPSSVQQIGRNPLMTCTGLQEIHVAKDNARYAVAEGALLDRKNRELICFPAGREVEKGRLELPDEVECIGYGAVADCGHIRSANLPEGLRRVGMYAFADCPNLSAVYFEAGTEVIEDYAFAGCARLRSVSLPAALREVGRKIFDGCQYKPRPGEMPRAKAKR